MRNEITCYINGERHTLNSHLASMMLSDYLRYEACLTGTKIVCAEGDCGACTVLRYFPKNHNSTDGHTYYAINSCITPMAILDGSSLITVDALATNEKLHPAQESLIECHGSQCGFCTPGFVMAMASLAEEKICKKSLTISKIEAKNALTGNLCRCTGYESIIKATQDMNLNDLNSLKDRFYSKEQDKDLSEISNTPVKLEGHQFSFYAPTKLEDAIKYLDKNPETKLVGSSTDLGVLHNKNKSLLTSMMSLHLIDELYQSREEDDHYIIGARVSITELRHFLKERIPEISKYLDIFASPQIKNLATVSGNIANASPIGDTPPALLILDAKLELISAQGKRVVNLSDFYLEYKKTILKPYEIIRSILIPKVDPKDFIKLYKNSNRKDLDISTVNFGIRVDQSHRFTIAAGGVAGIPLRLKKTEEFLNSNILNEQNINHAVKVLHSEFTPLSDLRGSSSYRRLLIENYFKRALAQYTEKQQ